MVGGVPDVIMCAKFQIEIFMGYDFTGVRIFDFCIDFSMGLTTVWFDLFISHMDKMSDDYCQWIALLTFLRRVIAVLTTSTVIIKRLTLR